LSWLGKVWKGRLLLPRIAQVQSASWQKQKNDLTLRGISFQADRHMFEQQNEAGNFIYIGYTAPQ